MLSSIKLHFTYKDFSEAMKKYYNVEPQTVNFQDTAECARKEINLWVEHQTAGKVQIIGFPYPSFLHFTRCRHYHLVAFYWIQCVYNVKKQEASVKWNWCKSCIRLQFAWGIGQREYTKCFVENKDREEGFDNTNLLPSWMALLKQDFRQQ